MGEQQYPGSDERERILADARLSIKKHGFLMSKATEEGHMSEALKYAVGMLSELRTSMLPPAQYYELFVQACDQMRNLEALFADEVGKGKSYAELYEVVQHAGSVLPRLYLMITVGCQYIESGKAPASEILKELVEMSKGVQHPTRGLFLRAYLCQRSRSVLQDNAPSTEPAPSEDNDVSSPPESRLQNNIDFLLSNFVEMNKLWIRLQHQGTARDKERRERERSQLQDLVGKNLTYISQLDGLTFDIYAKQVMVRFLEQIVSCKDDLGQQYLMQVLIQGFPATFHLGTLDELLATLPQLQAGVKVQGVMASLLDRMAQYALDEPSALPTLSSPEAFQKFRDAIAQVITSQTEIPLADAIEMYVALLKFIGTIHKDAFTYLDEVLLAAHKALSARGGIQNDMKAEKQLVALLTSPLQQYDVAMVLGLRAFAELMQLLQPRSCKDMAVRVAEAVLTQKASISTGALVEALFTFLAPLVEDVEGADDLDDEDIATEQSLIARVIHLISSPDVATHFQLLNSARTRLLRGGLRRARHTLPALGFSALQLARSCCTKSSASKETTSITAESILQWVLESSLMLAQVPEPIAAIRLMLAATLSASEELGSEPLASELLEQALMLYEEGLSDSRSRMTALHAVIGTLQKCYVFVHAKREAFVMNIAGYAAKMLKRVDQCAALCACSHVYWQEDRKAGEAGASSSSQPPVRDAQRVTGMLQRGVKVAESAKKQLAYLGPAAKFMDYVPLYLEVLNQHLFYFDMSVEGFDVAAVQRLLETAKAEIAESGSRVKEETRSQWDKIVQHIKSQKPKDKKLLKQYEALQSAEVLAGSS